jgi:hypothetical protein
MRTRIIVAFVLGALLALGAPALADHLFDDVPDDHPHAEGIEWAWTQGLVEGYDDGTYRPGEPLRRGQLATILMRQGAWRGPVASLTPFCDDDGEPKMMIVDHNYRGSTEADVEYSIDGGERVLLEEEIPDDGEPLIIDSPADSGVMSLFVDGIAWEHAPVPTACAAG